MGSDHPPATRIALAQAPAPEELARAATLDVPVLVSAASPSERSTYARLLHARTAAASSHSSNSSAVAERIRLDQSR